MSGSDTIIDVVAAAIEDRGGTLGLSKEGKRRLTEALAARAKKPNLEAPVRALLMFAFFLEHKKNAPAAAAEIVEILQTVKEPLLAQRVRLEDVVTRASDEERARRLVGSQSGSHPRRSGDAAAEVDAPVVRWWAARSTKKE